MRNVKLSIILTISILYGVVARAVSQSLDPTTPYYQKIVSGQEVLDLIDNWDETDFGLAVDGVKNGMFEVNDVDKNDPNAVFTYWDKESGWYIDPNAYYRASFLLYQDPRKESDRGISDLYFHLVEDPSLSDENTTKNED